MAPNRCFRGPGRRGSVNDPSYPAIHPTRPIEGADRNRSVVPAPEEMRLEARPTR